jgi:hypothetical protein
MLFRPIRGKAESLKGRVGMDRTPLAINWFFRDEEVAPKMMSVEFHYILAGRPGRARSVKKFLDHA